MKTKSVGKCIAGAGNDVIELPENQLFVFEEHFEQRSQDGA
jgi:hypothetical protein